MKPHRQSPDSSLTSQRSSTQLWQSFNDNDSLPLFRVPALLELARRSDGGVLATCEKMIASQEVEQWLVAVEVLGALGTNEAVRALGRLVTVPDPFLRRKVLEQISKLLTQRTLGEIETKTPNKSDEEQLVCEK